MSQLFARSSSTVLSNLSSLFLLRELVNQMTYECAKCIHKRVLSRKNVVVSQYIESRELASLAQYCPACLLFVILNCNRLEI